MKKKENIVNISCPSVIFPGFPADAAEAEPLLRQRRKRLHVILSSPTQAARLRSGSHTWSTSSSSLQSLILNFPVVHSRARHRHPADTERGQSRVHHGLLPGWDVLPCGDGRQEDFPVRPGWESRRAHQSEFYSLNWPVFRFTDQSSCGGWDSSASAPKQQLLSAFLLQDSLSDCPKNKNPATLIAFDLLVFWCQQVFA